MKTVAVPKTTEEKIDIIERYFYGSRPHYLKPKDNGKDYLAHWTLRQYEKDDDADAREVIAEHVTGKRVWAAKPVSSDGAQFAALDIDFDDNPDVTCIRAQLDRIYGEGAYNWEERPGSGIHVWLLWDGAIPLETAEQLICLMPQRDICIAYPRNKGVLRLPFPGDYDPLPRFGSEKLAVLSASDIEAILTDGRDSSEAGVSDGLRESESVVTHPTQYRGGLIGNNNSSTCSTYCVGRVDADTNGDGSTDTESKKLRERVDQALSDPPEDGCVYQVLILENLLSNCLGVYGAESGLKKIKEWIRRGTPDRVNRRLQELQKYHKCNVRNGHAPALPGPLCRPIDLQQFDDGMFEDELTFISRRDNRRNVGRCLFAMLVCEQRARDYHVPVWWISTGHIAEALGYDQENGRKRAGRHLSWIVEERGAEDLPAFRIVRRHTRHKATCYALNQEYEYLLDRLPELEPLIAESDDERE